MQENNVETKSEFRTNKQIRYNQTIKRTMDLFLSTIILILLLPFFILISLTYLFEEKKGAILFRQKRVGENGKEFYIYKFRSMIIDAEKKLKENTDLYKEFISNGYKLEQDRDPRITKIGFFLRKTSLDELPQLFNVIKGEMSLVGPRPIIEEELKEYQHRRNEFLSVKPGMTGLWQVSGRSEIAYPERTNLELKYIKKQSFLFDMKILFMTVITVLKKKGAV
ncbi:sugar transferase [Marinococcus halotolerans]|uniref:sugar transferase n=1 Tax=Marinococcus halotolerans TaxID=301092 RepID=UPI0003B72213|nr:sugar transferase [Marinococcus halotolerans]